MFSLRHDDQVIPKKGALNAFGAFAYIAAVVTLMSNLEKLAGPDDHGILAPLVFLSLFVLSAAVMGMLVFAAPVMLYIDGKKKEAVRLLAWTIGSFAAITVCLLGILALSAV